MNGGATVSPLHYLPMKEISNHLEGGEQRKGKKNDEGELTASSCDLTGAGVRVPDRPSLRPACRPRGRWREQACPHGSLSIESKRPAPHLARGRGSAGVSQGGLGRHSEHWQGHVCLENLLCSSPRVWVSFHLHPSTILGNDAPPAKEAGEQ